MQRSPMQLGNQLRPHPGRRLSEKGCTSSLNRGDKLDPQNWKGSPGTLVIFPSVSPTPSVSKATGPFQTLLSLTSPSIMPQPDHFLKHSSDLPSCA